MTSTFLSRPTFTSCAVTFAPLIYGVPIVVSLPSSTIKTLSKISLSPSLYSPESFSICKVLPAETTYCLPPVAITANSFGVIGTADFGASFDAVLVVPFAVLISFVGIFLETLYFTQKKASRKAFSHTAESPVACHGG